LIPSFWVINQNTFKLIVPGFLLGWFANTFVMKLLKSLFKLFCWNNLQFLFRSAFLEEFRPLTHQNRNDRNKKLINKVFFQKFVHYFCSAVTVDIFSLLGFKFVDEFFQASRIEFHWTNIWSWSPCNYIGIFVSMLEVITHINHLVVCFTANNASSTESSKAS